MGGPFSAYAWLQLLALGGVSGALGQGIRTVVGLKKVYDAASGAQASFSDLVAWDRFVISISIGFIAGALAASTTITDLASVTGQQILALAAAGYAGADFIEGFMTRVAPATNVAVGQESVGVATGAAPVVIDDGTVG
jgi:hypothetical protein